MCYSHAWNYKKLKKNQYGESPISSKKKIPSENDNTPVQSEINHKITDIQFTYDSDSEVENTVYENSSNLVMSWVKFCAVTIIKTIINNP